uniref:G-protein coupled receptors family 1 profile domain-containing protein n=1 Tax=Arion vulgaris TaxID=1028688 RepID=A0A0B7APK7_9EUPU
MGYFDSYVYIQAHKALIVIFIISILLINGFLIFKIVRKGGFFYNPRSLTIISLSIGDIFLALFSLSVWAKFYYDDVLDMTCSTANSSIVYQEYLIHFVYGVGLIVLAGELVHRYKGQVPVSNNKISIIKSIGYSAAPWLLGLVIVLPLTLAGDNDLSGYLLSLSCRVVNKGRFVAVYVISMLLPVWLAPIVSILIICIKLLPLQQVSQNVVNGGATQCVVIDTNTSNMGQQYPMSGIAVTQPQTSPPNIIYNSNLQGSEFTAASTQYTLDQYPSEHYNPNMYYTQPYLPLQDSPQINASTSNLTISDYIYPIHSQPPIAYAIHDPGKERKTLLLVSMVLFVCVIPLAIYTLVMASIDEEDTITVIYTFNLIAQSTFFWLSLCRSIITPIIWIVRSRNEN